MRDRSGKAPSLRLPAHADASGVLVRGLSNLEVRCLGPKRGKARGSDCAFRGERRTEELSVDVLNHRSEGRRSDDFTVAAATGQLEMPFHSIP